MYFGQLANRFNDCFHRQAYQEALDLLNNAADQLPNHAGKILVWQASCQALLGDAPGAIVTFQSALAAGYWYHEEALKYEPDFASLQDYPEFQRIIAECQQRREHDESTIKPELALFEPSTLRPWPLLITLHGNESHLADYAPHWRSAAAQGWLVAVPQSTQLSWAGGYFVWDDYDQALAEIQQLYADLTARYAIDPQRVIMAGYSMGGEVAQKIALTRALPVSGFIGVEGFVFDLDQLRPLIEAKQNPGLRSYLITGQYAQFFEPTRQIDDLLRAQGYASCRAEMDNEYHGFGSTFEAVLAQALAFVE